MQLVVNKETKASVTPNGWLVRVCINSNDTMGSNAYNVTGHYSAVKWYRCVSIAVQQRNYYCVCLYIKCCHSSHGAYSAVTKYFNQTYPGDKPEKQGAVRHQLTVQRWSARSETTKKTNPQSVNIDIFHLKPNLATLPYMVDNGPLKKHIVMKYCFLESK